MAGLVPAIHVFPATRQDVDARDKRGHDEQQRSVYPRFAAASALSTRSTISPASPR
jgi:hypothetical protein